MSVTYYNCRSTLVYVAFLDASRAFDKTSHWTLFKKLIDRHAPLSKICILLIWCSWYQHQVMTVTCSHRISNSFNVTNGVRRVGVLSQQLFIVYIDGLNDIILNKSAIGGSLAGKRKTLVICR